MQKSKDRQEFFSVQHESEGVVINIAKVTQHITCACIIVSSSMLAITDSSWLTCSFSPQIINVMERTVMKSRTARRDVASDGPGEACVAHLLLQILDFLAVVLYILLVRRALLASIQMSTNDAKCQSFTVRMRIAHASARPTSAFSSAGDFVQYGLEMLAGGLAAANAPRGRVRSLWRSGTEDISF